MPRMHPLAPFRIFDTVQTALRLVTANASVLARLGAMPLLVVCLNAAAIAATGGTTPLQSFIYGLPAIFATGYMMFLATRLWLLGELPAFPVDAPATRRAHMQASVIAYTLWKALGAIYDQIMITVFNPPALLENPDALNANPGLQVLFMAMSGILLWALRFRVVPVLAAVGYPLRDYVRRANGFAISFRLLALVMICVEMPRALLLSPLLADSSVPALIVLPAGNAVTFILEIWLFAAFCVALKTMLTEKTR